MSRSCEHDYVCTMCLGVPDVDWQARALAADDVLEIVTKALEKKLTIAIDALTKALTADKGRCVGCGIRFDPHHEGEGCFVWDAFAKITKIGARDE